MFLSRYSAFTDASLDKELNNFSCSSKRWHLPIKKRKISDLWTFRKVVWNQLFEKVFQFGYFSLLKLVIWLNWRVITGLEIGRPILLIQRKKWIFLTIFIFQDVSHLLNLPSDVLNNGFQEPLGFFKQFKVKKIQGTLMLAQGPNCKPEKVLMHSELETKKCLQFLPSWTSLVHTDVFKIAMKAVVVRIRRHKNGIWRSRVYFH